MNWELHSEGSFRIIVTMQYESFPTSSTRSAVFKLGCKFLNLDEILIGVFILSHWSNDIPEHIELLEPPYIAREFQFRPLCYNGIRSGSDSEQPVVEGEVENPAVLHTCSATSEAFVCTRSGLVCL